MSSYRPTSRPFARVLPALVLVLVLVGCDVYGPGWSGVHADSRNSDYSDVVGPDDLTLAWEASFGGRINLGPTSGPDGTIYVTTGTATCPLHALDPDTGEEIWCSSEVGQLASLSSPVVDDDGRLFVADGEAMHAFTPDGDLIWETPIVGVPLSAQLTPNGRVVFITNVGVVYVLRRSTGQPVMPPVELVPGATFDPADVQACAQGTAACAVANTPAIDLGSGTIYTTFWAPGAPQAAVVALHLTEDPAPLLTEVWVNDTLPGGSGSSPTISADGSRVYVTDNVDALHALDAVTGETIWSVDIGFAAAGSPSVTPEGLVMPAGGTGARPVLAVQDDGASGRIAWTRTDLVNRGIPLQTAGGRAYAAVRTTGFANEVAVIDTADGSVIDRTPIPGTSVFTVGTTVAQDGAILVPTITGRLYAYRGA